MRRAVWGVFWVAAVIIVAVGLLLSFSAGLGLGRVMPVADLVPIRNAFTVGACAVAVMCAVIAAVARLPRPITVPLLCVGLILGGVNIPIIVARGMNNPAPTSAETGQLRLLEWNTNGTLVSPEHIAKLAVAQKANVIVLPDANIEYTARSYRTAFAEVGLSATLFPAPGSQPQLAVLVAGPFADSYRVGGSGPESDRSLLLTPTNSALPTIVALHAPHPAPSEMTMWNAMLDWGFQHCQSTRTVIAGDFNAGLDSLSAGVPAGCPDAAQATGNASTGTWPTSIPAFFGMAIDHVLVAPGTGAVSSFSVLTGEDASGARHRPTMTVITLDS